MNSALSVDIVIVNWNSGNQLQACLKSIQNSIPKNLYTSIVVIDNASKDQSMQGIPDNDAKIKVIQNNTNKGFAAACNQGAWQTNAHFILFLNPDVILNTTTLNDALLFMSKASNAPIGICGVQLTDTSGHISKTCSRFPSPTLFASGLLGLPFLWPNRFAKQQMVEWDHNHDAIVDQVMGAFFLIRRELFELLHGFDERFFVYFEEVDLAFRAKKAGYSSYFLSTTRAFHKGQGTTESVRGIALFYYLRSKVLYAFKHFGRAQAAWLSIGVFTIEPIMRYLQAILKRSSKDLFGTLQAYRYLYLWALGLIGQSVPL